MWYEDRDWNPEQTREEDPETNDYEKARDRQGETNGDPFLGKILKRPGVQLLQSDRPGLCRTAVVFPAGGGPEHESERAETKTTQGGGS